MNHEGAAKSFTLVNWNLEWRTSRSRAAAILRDRIVELDPDIICLTEAYADFFAGSGHQIEAEADYGYPLTPGRRKVLLWSRHPWQQIDQRGDAAFPTGRFVSGRTETALGEVSVVGVCIPWSGAHVSSGRRDRRRWQDHVTYVDALSSMLPESHRVLVVGDYNQTVPRTIAPKAVHQALRRAILDRLELATGGPIGPLGKQLIDHVAHSRDLKATEVTALSNQDANGRSLTDHFGVRVRFALG